MRSKTSYRTQRRSKKRLLGNNIRPTSGIVEFLPVKPAVISTVSIQYDRSRNTTTKGIKSPVRLNAQHSGESFIKPPWCDFPEIIEAVDVESYARGAIDKKHGLIFKEGYFIGGRSVPAIDYLKQRYLHMESTTEVPMRALMGLLLMDLLIWGNAFLVKVRDVKKSPGKTWVSPKWGIMKPIAAMYYAPARTMWPKIDKKTGEVVRWKQITSAGYGRREANGPEWSARDVVHFKFHPRGIGGIPEMLPVLSDIQVLRRIEEDVTLLVMKFLFPLTHVRVGTDNLPAKMTEFKDSDGTPLSEIDWLKGVIESADPSEGLVTDHRVEIDTVGAKDSIMDVAPYLKHFQARVFSGLGMSPIDFGQPDTANRATGETVSRNTLDTIRRNQSDFQWQWNWYVDRELLMESEIHRRALAKTRWEDYAGLRWPDPDIDMRIKKDNHYADLWTKSVITHPEARDSMGMNALSENEFNKSTFWALIDKPKTTITASAGMSDKVEEVVKKQVESAKAIGKVLPSQSSASKTSPKTAEQNKSVSSKNRPSNQYGTKAGPTKSTKDAECNDMMSDVKLENSDIPHAVVNEYDRIGKLLASYDTLNDTVVSSTLAHLRSRMIVTSDNIISTFYSIGIGSAVASDEERTDYKAVIERWAIPRVDRIIGALHEKMKTRGVEEAFDSIRYRVDYYTWTLAAKTLNYARVIQARHDGSEVVIDESQPGACNKCKELHGKYIDTKAFSIDELPPHHPKCNGSIRVTRRGKQSRHDTQKY